MKSNKLFKSIGALTVVLTLNIYAGQSQDINILPFPNSVDIKKGAFIISPGSCIYYDKKCRNEALYFQQLLANDYAFKIQIAETKSSRLSAGNIYLAAEAATNNTPVIKDEHSIKVDQATILLKGKSPSAVFYAIQSLRQLIKQDENKRLIVPQVVINDKPAFQWRGFMLDEGRYFKGSKVVKELLDEMAFLKMNIFHWHLTDDGGWRIEIKKYPKLTETGSKRRMSETGTWLSNVFDSIPHGGYYTQEEIKDIIRYASQRHITIIPEIEMPGHASAAIASYPWLGMENKQIEVPISFGIKPDIFNVVNPKVKQFLRDVLDEVMELFPSTIVHIGGDEVLYNQWKVSPEVNAYMKQNNIKSPADLQIDFTNSMAKYIEERGHRMLGWNDILGGLHQNNDSTDARAQQQLSKSAIIDFWTGDPKIVTEAAMKGYDVVNSYWAYTYLDYDTKTTPLEKVYSFNPVPDSLPPEYHKKILGLNTQMWGEWIPTVEKMNSLLYPRIAALAETAWTIKENKDLKRFVRSLPYYSENHLRKRGIILSDDQLQVQGF